MRSLVEVYAKRQHLYFAGLTERHHFKDHFSRTFWIVCAAFDRSERRIRWQDQQHRVRSPWAPLEEGPSKVVDK